MKQKALRVGDAHSFCYCSQQRLFSDSIHSVTPLKLKVKSLLVSGAQLCYNKNKNRKDFYHEKNRKFYHRPY